MLNTPWWYCSKGHCFCDIDCYDQDCPICWDTDITGPFQSRYQAEFVYLKRLDNKRLGE